MCTQYGGERRLPDGGDEESRQVGHRPRHSCVAGVPESENAPGFGGAAAVHTLVPIPPVKGLSWKTYIWIEEVA